MCSIYNCLDRESKCIYVTKKRRLVMRRNEAKMDRQNLTLLTDLYELTMMQGYFKNKDKTGMCPMENKYQNEMDVETIYREMVK